MTWLFHLVMHWCSFNIHLQQKHAWAEWLSFPEKCFSKMRWHYASSSSSRPQWQIKIEGHQILINQADWSLSISYGKRHQQHLNFSCISLQVHTKAQQTWTKQLAYWWLLNTNTSFSCNTILGYQSSKKWNLTKALLIQINFAANTSICLDGDKHHSHSK